MTRQCPICRAIGGPAAFPLLPQDEQPPRHDERRRRCIRCGHTARAWLFTPPKPGPPRATTALLLALALAALLVTAAGAQEAEDSPRYTPSVRGGRAAVQELAEAYFPAEWVGWAIATARCESGWDLYAHASGFDRRLGVWYAFWGALQVDAVSWGVKARQLFDGDLSEPAVNFAMAAWILEQYGPGHWPVCGRS